MAIGKIYTKIPFVASTKYIRYPEIQLRKDVWVFYGEHCKMLLEDIKKEQTKGITNHVYG